MIKKLLFLIIAFISIQVDSFGQCTPPIVTNNATYINNFSTTGGATNISNVGSGFSPNGYQNNFNTMAVSKFASGSVNFTLELVGGTAGVAVWVDWNNNNVFTVAERVYNSAGYINGPVNATITVPAGTPLGDYRMRVKIDWLSTNPNPCTNGGSRAETEDYKFTVIVAPPCAAQPTGLNATLITQTTARLNWTAATPAPALGYDYYYSTSPTAPTAGTTPSGTVGPGITLVNIAGLSPSTLYYYWVRSRCSATEQSSWNGSSFRTAISNDDCSGAVNLPVLSTCNYVTYTNAGATPSTGVPAPGCASYSGGDVWFSVTVPASGNLIIDTSTGTMTDSGMAIYSGSCAGLTLLECDDDDSPNGSMSSITRSGLTPGSTIYIRVWEFGNDNNGTFGICVSEPPPPPTNDNPCGALALTVNTDLNCANVTSGSVQSALGSGINPCFGTADDDVWFKFVATSTTHYIDLLNISGSTTDLYHALYGPYTAPNCTVTAGSNLLCSDPNDSVASGLVIGATYFLQVYTWSGTGGQTTNFDVCIGTPPPPPSNDLCSNATNLTCGTTNLAGTTISTSNISAISGCTMSNYGVWYTFVGDGQSSTISSTAASGFDHEMSISTGNCTNQSNITCQDNAGSGGTETYTFNTTNGVQYYVYIAFPFSYGDNSDTGNFTISRSCAPPSYCIPSSTDSGYYINNFTTTGGSTNINHTGSGYSPGGYGNFTGQNVTQLPGGVINFNATFVGGTFKTAIWVDWNDDFDFDDPNETVYESTVYANPQPGSFTVFNGAPPGPHRMRVRSFWLSANPLPSCGYEDESETHDYTLIVTPLNCTANPINVIATATSTTTASISWTAPVPPPALGYDYQVSTNPSGVPVFTSGTIAGTSVNISGLTPNTTYYIFVRGRCNAIDQGYWVTTTLTTGCTNIVTTPTTCPLIVDEQGNNPFTTVPFVADPTVAIDCNLPSVTLAVNANLRQTTSYIVEQITYPNPAPVYDFGSLGGAQAISSDDVWADSRTNLGFNFCFYNNNYTQTLAGANGAITFNSAITPGSASGYAFSNNIPSTAGALFEQTIYGVYHDIDPRNLTGTPIKSRTIGEVGCRQFQVSWNNIPMFGDATRLYTGMIVLHETTNIIEVFIKEKRIENGNVSPWNGGNALVGVQGRVTPAPAQALAAPCRNSLDTNWETTNEAWRFTPNGAVINPTSVTWYQGAVAPGNVIGTASTVNVSDAGTYFASVTYNLCGGPVTLVDEIVVTSNKKTWNGSTSSNWYKDTNWTPIGAPTATDCVVIPDVSTTSNRSPIADLALFGGTIPLPPIATALARTVTVRNNGYLQVNAGTYLEIVDGLTVEPNGEVLIRSTGSLVQTTDVTTNNNTGNIRMQREVTGVGPQNYVYWSSPVEGFNVGNINMAASEPRWQWEPTTSDIYGNWTAASGPMTVGRGYIVRGLATPPSPIPPNNAEFLGRPSNGVINVPITRGNYTGIPYAGASPNTQATNLDDNWNLVGNPYPSAISGSAFISENATGATPKIDGVIYLWSHAGLPVGTTGDDPFYGDYVYNYLGSSYVAYNGTGSNPPIFNGNIASGQSFFVQMEDIAGMNNTVLFNNGMRSVTQANDDFLRTTERHRIWLDLVSENDEAISTLVGYVMEATNDKDRLYDANDLNDTPIQFYSLLGDIELTIQGRALPLDQEDRVPLGIVVPQNATYKIAINSVDGLFAEPSQNVFLEDTYLNTIYDLRLNPYEFTSESGTFNDRFILRYTNETLSTLEQVANFGFNIIGLNDYIKVTSGGSPINTIKVYDVLGRLLADYKDVNAQEFKLELVNQSEGALIVKATLYNGQQKIKKVIY